eukprot:scaffold21439_cov129-Isochrysis_galbana.AAC.5
MVWCVVWRVPHGVTRCACVHVSARARVCGAAWRSLCPTVPTKGGSRLKGHPPLSGQPPRYLPAVVPLPRVGYVPGRGARGPWSQDHGPWMAAYLLTYSYYLPKSTCEGVLTLKCLGSARASDLVL